MTYDEYMDKLDMQQAETMLMRICGCCCLCAAMGYIHFLATHVF